MSETHEVVCDECGDTHSLNCGLVAKPRPPKTWTRDGASDYCPDCSEDRCQSASMGTD